MANDDSFINNGGMINFYQENKRVLLEISLQEVLRNQLTISSELLKLVKITDNANSKREQWTVDGYPYPLKKIDTIDGGCQYGSAQYINTVTLL